MLDYRAHKLYLITVTPIKWIFTTIWFIVQTVLPVIVAIKTTDGEWLITLIVIYYLFSLMFIGGLFMWSLILLEKIFFFFIDVEPTSNHSKEEAIRVVKYGSNAITVIKMEKTSPYYWEEEDIIKITESKIFFPKYFIDKNYEGFIFIKNYYRENNIKDLCSWNHMQEILKENKIKKGLLYYIIFFSYGIVPYLLQLVLMLVTYKYFPHL